MTPAMPSVFYFRSAKRERDRERGRGIEGVGEWVGRRCSGYGGVDAEESQHRSWHVAPSFPPPVYMKGCSTLDKVQYG